MFPYLEMPKKIANFKIIEKLGEGGMGSVFIAFDEKLKRNVALKILKKDLILNETAKARFKREAYLLSSLEHPNICRIYDLIEEDEKIILVLELIKGNNLKEIIKKNFNWNFKMKIAIQICNVLKVVHSKGIIHRDLKPQNILVMEDGIIKVLDFGLAGIFRDEEMKKSEIKNDIKELKRQEDEETLIIDSSYKEEKYFETRAGTVMGTLEYMSPEQARGEKVTTKTDIYSFGLILQELFTGKQAFKLADTLKEIIKNAQNGQTSPVEGIDKDLKILIERMKSISVDSRPAAGDVLEKLEWISQKPKRKIKRIVFSLFVFFIIIFGISMLFLNLKISKEKKKAQMEEKISTYVSKFLTEIFEASDPYIAKGEQITAREILEDAVKKIRYEFKGEPKIKNRLEETLGKIYLTLGVLEKAELFLKSALKDSKMLYGEEDENYASSLQYLAYFYKIKDDYKKAEILYNKALIIYKKSKGNETIEVARILNDLGELKKAEGNFKEAELFLKNALKIFQKSVGYYNEATTTCLNNLAILYEIKGEYEKAEQIYKKILSIDEKILGAQHPNFATDLLNLSDLYITQGKMDKAEELILVALKIDEKVFGRNNPAIANDLNNLAAIYYEKKDFERAELYYREAIKIWENTLGKEHSMVALAKRNLGLLYFNKEDYKKAEKLYKEALSILEKTLPPDHPYIKKVKKDISVLYDKTK